MWHIITHVLRTDTRHGQCGHTSAAAATDASVHQRMALHTLTHKDTTSIWLTKGLQGRHYALSLLQVNRIWPIGLYYNTQQSCSGCVFLLNIVEVVVVFKSHA